MTEASDGGDFDIMVIGAGPAGIAAASVCAEAGKRVLVVEQNARPGGQIWRHRVRATLPGIADRWLTRLEGSGAKLLLETTAVGVDATRAVLLSGGKRLSRVTAEKIILATGGRELFLPFPGWTLPWVLGVGGAQALLKEGVSFSGKRVVVAGSGPLLLPVAAALIAAGARVTHVLEQATAGSLAAFSAGLWRDPSRLVQAAGYGWGMRSARYMMGAWIERAEGDGRVQRVAVRTRNRTFQAECDVLCTGYGLLPASELASTALCDLRDGAVLVDDRQHTSVPGIFCAGEAAGVAGVENALAQGQAAGHTILGAPLDGRTINQLKRGQWLRQRLGSAFAPREEVLSLATPDTIVCRCEDVRESRVDHSWSWRELKLRTRIGMGACQGRICGGAMRARFRLEPGDVRFPVLPVTVGELVSTPASSPRLE